MIARIRPSAASFLLAGTALLTVAALPSLAVAAQPGAFTVAQAKPEEKPEAKPEQPKPAQPQRGREAPKPPAPAAQQAPAQQAPAAQPRPAAQERREERREERQQRREERANQRQQPPAPAAQQSQPATPPAAQTPPTAQDRRTRPPQPAPATAQQPQNSPSTAPSTAPATAQQPATQTAPTTQQQRREQRQQERANQRQPQPAPAATQQPAPQTAPATAQQPAAPQAPAAAATVAPPTQTRDAREFIRRDGQGPSRSINEVRQQRQESRDGDRTIIREGDRTIIRDGNRTIIRHNESSRFSINARNVRTERRGANTETIVQRGGYSIVTVSDANGRLLRRVRRDERGREVIIIDNRYTGPRASVVFVQLPPPVIRIPRERYIVEMRGARREAVYEVFLAPPVEAIAEPYTLEQVRFSAPLRDRMPRVDLDVTFDTGSWQLLPEQVDKLSVIAEGLKQAIQRNPKEVFMVEGYTDATGAEEDNLSLSDRRAESVAVALTEQFQVPPENLVTQGYGEQYLKVDTQGPEELNRRVAVRRITPLLDKQAASTGAR